jgi:hypothetical protein
MKSTGIVAAAVAGSLAVATLATTATAAAVTSLTELNAHLDTAGLTTVQRQVGFLTEGNYQRVENELSSNVVKKIYDSSAALHDAVENGTVVAGLVSGTPDASRDFNIFPSEQISVRSMLVKPGNDAVVSCWRFVQSCSNVLACSSFQVGAFGSHLPVPLLFQIA